MILSYESGRQVAEVLHLVRMILSLPSFFKRRRAPFGRTGMPKSACPAAPRLQSLFDFQIAGFGSAFSLTGSMSQIRTDV